MPALVVPIWELRTLGLTHLFQVVLLVRGDGVGLRVESMFGDWEELVGRGSCSLSRQFLDSFFSPPWGCFPFD